MTTTTRTRPEQAAPPMRNWPLSGLSARTDRVELRWPTTEDLDDLADRGAEGVHAPGFMPFFSQWTDGDRQTVSRRVLQRHWNSLASWNADDWTLYLVVVHDGRVVGSQSLGARNFAATREVLLTSWLALDTQGQGIGGHARAAVLELAFAGLGAQHAFSVVRQGNEASQAVCRKFGFEADGTQINAVRGRQVVSDRYRLSREGWERHREIEVRLAGVDRALPLFGLGPDAGSAAGTAAAEPAPAAVARPVLAEALSGVRYAEEADACTD